MKRSRKLSTKSRSQEKPGAWDLFLPIPWKFHRRFMDFWKHHPGTECVLDDHRCLKPFPHQTLKTYPFDKLAIHEVISQIFCQTKNSHVLFQKNICYSLGPSVSLNDHFLQSKLQVFRLYHYLGIHETPVDFYGFHREIYHMGTFLTNRPFRVVLGVRSTRKFQVSLRNSPPPMFDVGKSFFFLHAVAAPHLCGLENVQGQRRRRKYVCILYTVYMVNRWWL